MYISTSVIGEFWKRVEAIEESPGPLTSRLLDADHISGYFERNRVESFLRTFDGVLERYSESDPALERPSETPAFAAHPTSAPYELDSLRLEVAEKRWKNKHRSSKFGTPPSRPGNKKKADVDPFWAHDLLNLWAVIVNEHQRPAQKKLDEAPDEDTAGWYERVRCGFLPGELASAVMGFKEADNTWDRGLVSLVLDIGNDLGIAVPSTHNQAEHSFGGQMVYRQYRAGENAPAASSRPQDLARENPEEAYENIDSFLTCLLKIDPGTSWGDLNDKQRERVADLAKASLDVETKTTKTGSLKGARLATVKKIDEENGIVEVLAEGPSLDDLGDWAEIPIDSLGEEVAGCLENDLRFMWYMIKPREGGHSPEETEHRFELLADAGRQADADRNASASSAAASSACSRAARSASAAQMIRAVASARRPCAAARPFPAAASRSASPT